MPGWIEILSAAGFAGIISGIVTHTLSHWLTSKRATRERELSQLIEIRTLYTEALAYVDRRLFQSISDAPADPGIAENVGAQIRLVGSLKVYTRYCQALELIANAQSNTGTQESELHMAAGELARQMRQEVSALQVELGMRALEETSEAKQSAPQHV